MCFVKPLYCIVLFLAVVTASAQQPAIYTFQKDDSTLREKLYQQALLNKTSLINSLEKKYKSDYKEIYEGRFEGVADLLRTTRTVSEPAAHSYLQSLFKKITDANPELKSLELRLVFTRDGWPNAYSMGEGTLAVNAGLFVFLDNEAELVFVLCHEIAHLYLDHSNKSIKKSIEFIHSEELKQQAKQLSKQQYRVGEKLTELMKKLSFESHRHSRDDEAEADKYALKFMKPTGFDCKQATTCLQLLGKIDDTTLFKPISPEAIFNFSEYPFRKKWTEKETSIFSAMKEDDASPLTKAEKDSLRTHPDIPKRIELLKDSIEKVNAAQPFLVDQSFFNQLKKQFIAEITEQTYRNENFGLYLYRCLQLLQKEEYSSYAAYGVIRSLNRIYENQKTHKLGMVTDKESREYPADYNLVLRMIDKLKLDEIANLSYYFGKQYNSKLTIHKEFADEMHKAEKLKLEN